MLVRLDECGVGEEAWYWGLGIRDRFYDSFVHNMSESVAVHWDMWSIDYG